MDADLLALRTDNEKLRSRVAELERQVALYQAIYEALPVPSVVLRADGVLVDINRDNRAQLGVPSREAVIGRYNINDDPASATEGFLDHHRRSIASAPGEIVRMPPSPYNTAEANFAHEEDRQIWTQTSARCVEVDGVRYSVSVNLDVTERIRAQRAAAESQTFLGGIVEEAPFLIYVKDREGRYLLINKQFERLFGLPRAEILGKTDRDLFPAAEADDYMRFDRQAILSEAPSTREDTIMPAGEPCHMVTTKFALRDPEGRPHALCSISLDVTERRNAEQKARELQDEMLRVQEATLRALSTPLLPIAEGVVVMPLIGNIDARRAQQALETLLAGVVAHQAGQVIVDVTGVPVVDDQVADALVRTANAVRLLGAQVLLTGVQPAIARTLIELGVDLGGMRTLSTLQSGIAHALAGRGPARGRPASPARP